MNKSDKKTILVTGANSGIGKEICAGLAELGHNIIVVGRKSEKTDLAYNEIKNTFPKSSVYLEYCDFADLEQVVKLAKAIEKYPELNVLINNAGLEMSMRNISKQGYELTLAVNYFAPFFLTELLIPKLIESAPARIIMTSSLVEKWGKIDFENMQLETGYDPEKAYYRSKLALLMYTYDLSIRFKINQLTANSFEPGITKTNFTRDFRGIMKYGSKIMSLFMHSAKVPAKTAIYLSTSDEVASITGTNFYNSKIKETSSQSHDKNLTKKLMEYTNNNLKGYIK
jgi:NAD(P)-dependent dehydrogenase (short-subunit alcohol dehydrogenase family)